MKKLPPLSASPRPDAPGTKAEASPAARAGRPRFSEVIVLVLLVWTFLAIMTAVLQWWIGNKTGLHLLAILIALGFAFSALFDYFWRYLHRPDEE